jgi:hypothetical protein
MVETAILSQWMHRENLNLNYARWKDKKEGEVDLVLLDDKNFKPIWGIEIKWSNRYFEKTNELKSMMQFCKNNKLTGALVTTINLEGNKTFQDIEFTFLPAALYAYNVGVNTLKIKGNNEY